MEKKFHITITDNETGEVLREVDTCAIIGGYATDEGAVGMCFTSCNLLNHAKAINAAESVVNASYQKVPKLKLATLFTSAHATSEEVNQ